LQEFEGPDGSAGTLRSQTTIAASSASFSRHNLQIAADLKQSSRKRCDDLDLRQS